MDTLMKSNSQTLGFLPEAALRDYFAKDGVLGAKTDEGKLVGYLLYTTYPDKFRIAQLCVSKNFRRAGIAKMLVNQLKESAENQKSIRLNCRRDFPADKMWPKLGFIALDEMPGRSAAGSTLVRWCLTLAPDDQLSLFQAKVSDDALDVVIDAQVFFDLDEDEPDSDTTKPSQALFSDFLVDSINLWITDELFNEIHRNDDPEQRKRSRDRTHGFPQIKYDSQLAERYEKVLSNLLSSTRESQRSDILHLAKAAASEVKTFVTRDQDILNKVEGIAEKTGVRVLPPTELIIQLHELSRRQTYISTRISGSNLEWRRLTADDLRTFQFDLFLEQGERKSQLKEKLNPFLAEPNHYECHLLRDGDKIIAIHILTSDSENVLTVNFARVAHVTDEPLFNRFLIADTVFKAVKKNLNMVKIKENALVPRLVADLREIGFTECGNNFVRFCFSCCLDREKVLSEISGLSPESASKYQKMPDLELERHCSPLSLVAEQRYFLVPIKPGYAINLVGTGAAQSELFPETRILLRWDNVYYRHKTRHRMLSPPARILWYASAPIKKVVAVSHLDAVKTGIPKALLKKFKKLGILEWKDLYRMCNGDTSREIMALQFSHTFPFRRVISLEELRLIFQEDETRLCLQSPSKVSMETAWKIFQFGYPDQR